MRRVMGVLAAVGFVVCCWGAMAGRTYVAIGGLLVCQGAGWVHRRTAPALVALPSDLVNEQP